MSTPSTKKAPPGYLFALGRTGLPAEVTAGRSTYRFVRLFKHDFFAATGLYERAGEPPATPRPGEDPRLAVLKVQRTYPLFGLPMRWLGRHVARHEIRIYRKLQGIAGVPTFLGEVGPTGFLHAFVPGCELRPDLPLTPAFFDRLHELMTDLHDRGIAYVDTNKRENILYGDDAEPWLIDFQISFGGGRGSFLTRPFLRRLQAEDWYHYYKHKARLLPDACTPEELARGTRQSWIIRLHRTIAQPLIRLRRRFLSRYQLEKVK